MGKTRFEDVINMAKHKLGKTSQKLYFARFFLEAIEKAKKDEHLLNQKALLVAHQEACLFQLVSAYRGLVWEVANTYDEVFDIKMEVCDLAHVMETRGKSAGELDRLLFLEQTSNTWLNQMMGKWSVMVNLNPDATSPLKQQTNLNAIEVRVFSSEDELMQLSDWYENLSILIEEIRGLLVEW